MKYGYARVSTDAGTPKEVVPYSVPSSYRRLLPEKICEQDGTQFAPPPVYGGHGVAPEKNALRRADRTGENTGDPRQKMAAIGSNGAPTKSSETLQFAAMKDNRSDS